MLARVLTATVAGGIVFFVLGGIIFALILDPLIMKPNANPEIFKVMKDPPNWVFVILFNLVAAFLLAYIFEKWASISTFAGGFIGGAVIYFIVGLYSQCMSAAFMNMWQGITPMIADLVATTILGGAAGGVIGMVLGKMNKRTAAG